MTRWDSFPAQDSRNEVDRKANLGPVGESRPVTRSRRPVPAHDIEASRVPGHHSRCFHRTNFLNIARGVMLKGGRIWGDPRVSHDLCRPAGP